MTTRKPGSAVGSAKLLVEPGMWDQLRLAWRLFRDPRVAPRLKTVVPALAALYVLSPVDVLPDFLLGAGQLDDLGMIGLALVFLTRLVPRLAPPHVLAEHLAALGLSQPAATAHPPRSGGGPVVDASYRVRR